MLHLISDDTRRDPYPLYAQARAAAPVLKVPGSEMWMVLDYDGAKRALTDLEAFSSNAAPARGLNFEWLLFMDPPRHTKLRALISKAFTPRSVTELEPRVRELARELIARVAPRGQMDLVADFAAPLPMMVIAQMLGVPVAEWPQLTRWSEAIMGLGSTIAGTPEESRAASEAFLQAHAQMAEYLDPLVRARRSEPRDDLLTRLAAAEVDGERLTDMEILRFVQLLLAAGTETTTNLIDNAMLCFMEHPGELARLRAEPALLPTAIEEVLRYRSPAQAMFRATRREVELGGAVIPAGRFVLVMLGAANRDAAHFSEPDRFDIAREPNPHIAFGHGIHFCVGAPLSRLEARVALTELLARFASFERAESGPWTPRKPFHIHGPAALPIRFTLAG